MHASTYIAYTLRRVQKHPHNQYVTLLLLLLLVIVIFNNNNKNKNLILKKMLISVNILSA